MQFTDSAEWRTFFLILCCYLLIILVLLNPMGFSVVVSIALTIPLITLHSSLQHECMHGHPFKAQRLNDALICIPIGFFLSYFRFKAAHIKHHQDCILADPYEDPESWYQDSEAWAAKQRWLQRIFEFNNTLVGRMLIGPAISMIGFVNYEIKNGSPRTFAIWCIHLVGVCLICSALLLFGEVPLWAYLISCYFGYSLLMVRTFLEHQAHESIRERTVIIEDKGLLSYLFLNNNLHVVHHANPKMAWYRLPGFFEENRDYFLGMNKGYYFKNYLEIFKRFAFYRKEPVAYPLTSHSTMKDHG